MVYRAPSYPAPGSLTSHIPCRYPYSIFPTPHSSAYRSPSGLKHCSSRKYTVFFLASASLSKFFSLPRMSLPPPPCSPMPNRHLTVCAHSQPPFTQARHQPFSFVPPIREGIVDEGSLGVNGGLTVRHRRDFSVEDVKQLLPGLCFSPAAVDSWGISTEQGAG